MLISNKTPASPLMFPVLLSSSCNLTADPVAQKTAMGWPSSCSKMQFKNQVGHVWILIESSGGKFMQNPESPEKYKYSRIS